MNIINNTDYNEALLDTNNIKIIKKVKQKYKKYIPSDELENCLLVALWNSLKNFDESRGRKFTSYLYLVSEWECRKWLTNDKKELKHKQCQELKNDVSYSPREYNVLDDMLSILPRKLAKVIKQKIVHNMTFKEIAKKNKYSHETARKRYLEGIGVLSNAGTLYSK